MDEKYVKTEYKQQAIKAKKIAQPITPSSPTAPRGAIMTMNFHAKRHDFIKKLTIDLNISLRNFI